jgi:arginine/lysine/histidine transporter system substrate-binding protein
MKFIKIILTLAILSICTYLFFTQKSPSKNSSELIIGTTAGYAPFVSINPQGQYEGFDIDVANALAKEMGKKLILKDLGNMTSLFMALDQGKIDAIIWGMSITRDRLQKVAMINYQGELVTSYPLIFWEKIPANIKTMSDMSGKTVCVEPTSHQDDVLQKYYNSMQRLPTDKVDDALLNIQYGKADAAFVEPAIANKFKKKFPQIQIFDVALDPQDQVAGCGVVIKKDNSELINQISRAVDVLKKSGIISKFEQKWNMLP